MARAAPSAQFDCSLRQYENGNWQGGPVLLVLKVLVHGEKNIKLDRSQYQQFAVLDPRPTA